MWLRSGCLFGMGKTLSSTSVPQNNTKNRKAMFEKNKLSQKRAKPSSRTGASRDDNTFRMAREHPSCLYPAAPIRGSCHLRQPFTLRGSSRLTALPQGDVVCQLLPWRPAAVSTMPPFCRGWAEQRCSQLFSSKGHMWLCTHISQD